MEIGQSLSVKEVLDEIESGESYLTGWESLFVDDMFERWHEGWSMTDKQAEKLGEILNELRTRKTT